MLPAVVWLALASALYGQEVAPPSESQIIQSLENISSAIYETSEPHQVDSGCPNKIEDRSSDLCAQWKAADAAQDSAIWTERSFYLGAGVALVSFLTFIAAVAAALFARNAANAAAESVNVARQLGEAQTRAYLFCKSARYKLSKDSVAAIIEIGNSGQSPASRVSISGTVTIFEIGGTPSRSRTLSYVASDESKAMAQPIFVNSSVVQEIWFFWPGSFPAEDDGRDSGHLRDVFDNGNSISFNLTVQWSDVFGKRHEFKADFDAAIGPGPTSRLKARAKSGELELRMDDTQHGVVDHEPV
jgi:hypothetical protein